MTPQLLRPGFTDIQALTHLEWPGACVRQQFQRLPQHRGRLLLPPRLRARRRDSRRPRLDDAAHLAGQRLATGVR